MGVPRHGPSQSDPDRPEPRGVSSGVDGLDVALGGLYWGDNVVWLLDDASAEPFYRAVARRSDTFERVAFVALERDPGEAQRSLAEAGIIDARDHVRLDHPSALFTAVRRACDPRVRTLLLIESLDTLVSRWGERLAGRFYAACCPALLGVNAIAYWALTVDARSRGLADVATRVAQCVLRLDADRVRILKAEGRPEGPYGGLLRYEIANGTPRLLPASAAYQLATSLRALRRERGLSQSDLARLADITPSAISQAERSERGLSLETLMRLSSALGLTLDDLVRGGEPAVGYRVGRRLDDPSGEPVALQRLLLGGPGDPDVAFVRLPARGQGAPPPGPPGRALVAVAGGLVEITVGDATPVLRHGEVLMAESTAVDRWRNIGDRDAQLFWIVASEQP